MLRGRGFFRTAFYFPSVTSSVAITVLWLFLFTATGVVNKVLVLGRHRRARTGSPTRAACSTSSLGCVRRRRRARRRWRRPTSSASRWWEWLAGPSVAMIAFILMAIFTTSGTFMLLFLAALQNIGPEVDEAAMIDGANAWQRFWHVTLPLLKPTLFTVLTLGPDRHLAGLRPDLHRHPGRAREDDADARVPVVQRRLQPAGLGRGRGDRVHPLRDHRVLHRPAALGAARPGQGQAHEDAAIRRLQHAAVEAER